MRSDWSHCTFYRAQNTSARIFALLRHGGRAAAPPAHPEQQEELVRLLHRLGPGCEKICDELRTLPALSPHDLDELDARLRSQLELAEKKLPEPLGELEK